uniref:hypothetical protein n=1 Tax=Flavobacterium sp. TaxID=239 RepID=UPI0040486304
TYSDKLGFEFDYNFGYSSTDNFIFAITTTLSPIILAIGANFRPLRISFIFPIFIFSANLFWGWQQNAGECVGGVYYYISTYYVLGIAVDTVREPSIAPCTNNSFY